MATEAKKRVRMSRANRLEQLMGIAYGIASKKGLDAVTRAAVAAAAKIVPSNTVRYWATPEEMRGAVIEEAVSKKDVPVLKRAVKDGYDLSGFEMSRQLRRDIA